MGLAPAGSPNVIQGKKTKGWFRRAMQENQTNKECAVCIPDGAQLRCGDKILTFRQLSAEAYDYRDAFEFPDGSTRILQDLPEGLTFRVLSLSAREESLPQAAEQLVSHR